MTDPPAFSSDPLRVAVVGAGLSGLSAAHRLIELARESGRTIDLHLIEASPRVGGVIRTKRIGDYLVETGADSFITNKPWAVDLCRRMGLEDQLIPTDDQFRRSLVLRKGKPVAVPEGFMLLSPAKIWPVLTSPIFSPLGKLRMGLEYFLPRAKCDREESLAEFVRRRFGSEALDRLIQPLVGGIYTSDPEQLSLAATMPRFIEMERKHGSLIRASRMQKTRPDPKETSGSGARYGLFLTLKEGISQLLSALECQVRNSATIETERPVQRVVRRDREGYQLHYKDGSQENFDAVVLAAPAYRVAEMVQELDDQLSNALQTIEYASTAIVVSGHRLDQIDHPLDAFGLVVPKIENRHVLAISFSSRKFPARAPGESVLIRTFVGGATQPHLLEKSDEEILAMVQQELAEILGVRGEPEFAEVVRWNRAMPQYHLGHLDRVARIDECVQKHGGLALAGNAYEGVGIPDCIHSGELAAERLMEGLVVE